MDNVPKPNGEFREEVSQGNRKLNNSLADTKQTERRVKYSTKDMVESRYVFECSYDD